MQMATRVHTKAHPSQMSLAKVDSNVLLELFPFAIILDRDMRVKKCGEKLLETWILQNSMKSTDKFYNAVVTEHFKLRRPKGIQFNWKTVVQMYTVLFELELIREPEQEDNPSVPGMTAISEISTEDLVEEQLKSILQDEIKELGAAGLSASVPDGTSMPVRGAKGSYRLLLKGQMRHIVDIDSIVFLCSPL